MGGELHHCVKVLRTSIGETVEIVDGKGGVGIGQLESFDKRQAHIQLDNPLLKMPKAALPILAIAIPKNPSRWEYFLEKATEIGVSEIIPLICKRSDKSKIREERNHQIILSAFKQARQLYLPDLHSPTSILDVLSNEKYSDLETYIAHCEQDGQHQNPYLGVLHQRKSTSIILVGPEGDFTSDEIEAAKSKGYQAVSLGDSRLRVETAGIVACNIIKCIDQLT